MSKWRDKMGILTGTVALGVARHRMRVFEALDHCCRLLGF